MPESLQFDPDLCFDHVVGGLNSAYVGLDRQGYAQFLRRVQAECDRRLRKQVMLDKGITPPGPSGPAATEGTHSNPDDKPEATPPVEKPAGYKSKGSGV